MAPDEKGLTVGQALGHYRIEGPVGRGGMGEVYRAHDSRLDRTVALKVLPAEMASDADRLHRFTREAKALAALSHPNIVTVFSVDTSSETHYLTMELVEGRPLGEAIPKGGLSLEDFFAVAVPLADALAAAHDRGIVHRDLKPANVMLDPKGRPKVLDFGLAKSLGIGSSPEAETLTASPEAETGAGTVLGTVGYMSPEQVRGEPVDQRSDIFALGLLLYEMCTGRRAFDAGTPAEQMSAILRDSPEDSESLRPELPHHLGRVIRRCLEKDPERRYQSAKDVRNELEDLVGELRTEAILVREGGDPGRPPKLARFSLWIAGLALAVVGGVLLYRSVLAPSGKSDAGGPAPPYIESLAVLPFHNLMNDPEQAYFVEGMHEALIGQLSRIGALRVISRTSAMRYGESEKSLPEIARELDVDALVEGSVLRAEGKVRITAQLIDGTTDEHLWGASYDRSLEDVLTLLSDVAREIAGEIRIAMTPEQSARLAMAREVAPAAYEAFLRGEYAFRLFRAQGYRDAVAYYTKAIELQPDFAEAWAKLAGAHLLLGGFRIENPAEQEALAVTAAERALSIDPESGVAYAVLGWIRMYFHWDWTGAAEHFERSLAINPYDPYSCHGYGDYLTVMGRGEEGLEYIERAARADPLSPAVNTPVVGHSMYMRHYDRAIERAQSLLRTNPDYPAARRFMAQALWHSGRHAEALDEYRRIWAGDADVLLALEQGGRTSHRAAMAQLAQVLATRARAGEHDPLAVATAYALAGETEETFVWLEESYARRIPQLMLLGQSPSWDGVRNDPRFTDLLRRIGIPD